MASRAAVGIDLGTTNSSVAVVIDGAPQILADEAGRRTTPSIVSFPESGEILVGHEARRRVVEDPENTIYSSKRLIGRAFAEPAVRRARTSVPYKLCEGTDGDVAVDTRSGVYPIVEIAAMILRRMAQIAEHHLGAGTFGAVITVPANFNDRQREFTRVAGRIAGFEVLRIVNEPTAAALSFGFDGSRDGVVVVYDFGGGTFDVSVVEIKKGVYRVLSTAGDPFLGGDDVDLALAGRVADIFLREHRIDLRRRHAEWQRLVFEAERAKCDLADKQASEVVLEQAAFSSGGAVDLRMPLRRSDLASVAYYFVERSIALTRRSLEAAHLTIADVDDVVLCGGTSRVPLVASAVEDFFGRPPLCDVDPMHAVAMGAGMQAAMLTGVAVQSHKATSSSALLLDVLPHTIGLAIAGGRVQPVLHRNAVVPTQEIRDFTTHREGQTDLRLVLLQGDSPNAAENTKLGDFVVTGLRPARAGAVTVRVVFEVDANGILNVTAKDLDSGRECSRRLTVSAPAAEAVATAQKRLGTNPEGEDVA